MRKLASIQKIISIEPIKGADRIEKVSVLGWQTIAQKGAFNAGELCIFCEIDSILPFAPWSEFLRDKKNPDKPIRIKTCRMKGVLSQGVIFPLSLIEELQVKEGDDVTEVLGITKYEPYVEPFAHIKGEIHRPFPANIPKTDETRIQSVPDILSRHKGKLWCGTEKIDGCSATYAWIDGEFIACSRNIVIKESDDNVFWQVANKYRLKSLLEQFPYALQGEIIGPGIQGNRYHLKDYQFFAFNLFDIERQTYLPQGALFNLCNAGEITQVPTRYARISLDGKSIDDLIQMSDLKSYIHPEVDIEGIVWRPTIESTDSYLGRLSFKVINNKYLLKEK